MLTPDWDGDMTAFTPERMKSYSAAETLCPDARYAELQSFRDYLSDGTGKHVLELGSGNGTLTACLQGMGLDRRYNRYCLSGARRRPPRLQRRHCRRTGFPAR